MVILAMGGCLFLIISGAGRFLEGGNESGFRGRDARRLRIAAYGELAVKNSGRFVEQPNMKNSIVLWFPYLFAYS
jgi:hypothetical protein